MSGGNRGRMNQGRHKRTSSARRLMLLIPIRVDAQRLNMTRAETLLIGLGGIQREQLLRVRDPAQRVAADRDEPVAHTVDLGEGIRDQHRLLDRPAHRGDPAGLVDGRPTTVKSSRSVLATFP